MIELYVFMVSDTKPLQVSLPMRICSSEIARFNLHLKTRLQETGY